MFTDSAAMTPELPVALAKFFKPLQPECLSQLAPAICFQITNNYLNGLRRNIRLTKVRAKVLWIKCSDVSSQATTIYLKIDVVLSWEAF